MPNTYSQIYIQIVFAVKGRANYIGEEWEKQLYKYITGIVQNKGQKMLAINGVTNHIHIFIGMKPTCCLSDLVREIKKSSNAFINENKLSRHEFKWQEGFGAFSYHQSQIGMIMRYIANQKQHHAIRSFHDEYIQFLKEYKIEYNNAYLFEWYPDEHDSQRANRDFPKV